MPEKKIKIGLSYYGSKIQNYIQWLNSSPHQIEIVELNHSNNSPDELLKCTGLLLTGGQDINPEIYYQTNDRGLSKNISDERDKFEKELLDIALKNNISILGICRGLQITNAHLGGSLFQHIDNHRNESSSEDLEHSVEIFENTFLERIVNQKNGIVNSSHHQAVDKVAESLRVSAISNDGIVEALEWKDSENKSPLLLVQWHPERMKNKNENPFSKEILNWFINCQIK
ncbi:MAG: gamma-glutamyl-gamma-aminobutyrate hydrolase family protein [Ignavibacteria bacterium]